MTTTNLPEWAVNPQTINTSRLKPLPWRPGHHPVEYEIRRDRIRLAPSPVELHAIPNWFRRRLLAGYRGRWRWHSTRGPSVVLRVAEQLAEQHGASNGASGCWLDHWGSTTYRGQSVFVSEPYSIPDSAWLVIRDIAERTGCTVSLDANSWWYPGRTCRLVFTRIIN